MRAASWQMKYRLGLFEDPYRYSDNAREQATAIYKPEHLEAARDVARRSMVLLKNEDATLPLSESGTIALIGPLADSKPDMIGSWSAAGDRNEKPVTMREAFAARLGDRVEVRYARGAGYDFEDAGDTSGFAAGARRGARGRRRRRGRWASAGT